MKNFLKKLLSYNGYVNHAAYIFLNVWHLPQTLRRMNLLLHSLENLVSEKTHKLDLRLCDLEARFNRLEMELRYAQGICVPRLRPQLPDSVTASVADQISKPWVHWRQFIFALPRPK